MVYMFLDVSCDATIRSLFKPTIYCKFFCDAADHKNCVCCESWLSDDNVRVLDDAFTFFYRHWQLVTRRASDAARHRSRRPGGEFHVETRPSVNQWSSTFQLIDSRPVRPSSPTLSASRLILSSRAQRNYPINRSRCAARLTIQGGPIKVDR